MDAVVRIPAVTPTPATSMAMTPADVRQLRDTASKIEAIFLTQMLQMMRQASSNTGGPLSGQNQRVYQEMMDEQFGLALAKGGGIGLADLLARDVARRQGAARNASSQPPAVPISREGGLP
jgi:Rod binding domain-containing protein